MKEMKEIYKAYLLNNRLDNEYILQAYAELLNSLLIKLENNGEKDANKLARAIEKPLKKDIKRQTKIMHRIIKRQIEKLLDAYYNTNN